MFRYCPSCASDKIRFERNRVFRCPQCGFTYYHNTAAASGCLIRGAGGLLFLVRAKDPAKGKLDLPGGFVDPGEGVLEGLRRECTEELGWDPGPLTAGTGAGTGGGRNCELFASFPNTYPYKGITYTTCDLFFILDAPELSEKDLKIEPGEVSALRFIKSADIDLNELAFESTRRVVEAYLRNKHDAAISGW
jgi:8-oxo-dGTP pyrophosphatase MutT (NUDIX family)